MLSIDHLEAEFAAITEYFAPRGVEHFPYAPEETWIMFVEPASTTHTGDTPSPIAKTIESQLAHLR
jgi:hypothetical protein